MFDKNTQRFKSKIAVVVGATGGIGREISLQLAQHGFSLVLLGRNRQDLIKLKAECEAKKARVLIHEINLLNMKEIEIAAAKIKRVDLFIYAAGVIEVNEVVNESVKSYDVQMQVNLKAPVFLTKALLPGLIKSKGKIIFVNSTIVSQIKPKFAFYTMSKVALKIFADVLRREVSGLGVQVFSVFPGSTDTKMQKAVQSALKNSYDPQKFMPPKDVANAILSVLFVSDNLEATDLYIRPSKK